MDIGLSVSAIVVIVVMIVLAFVLWKVAKVLLIPIQILLFLVLMFIAYKLLFSEENADIIPEGAAKEKIQNLVDTAVDSASRLMKKADQEKKADPEVKDAPGGETTTVREEAAAPAESAEAPVQP